MNRVYADNGATSFPKAPGVSQAMKDFLDFMGCNINRGGYEAAYDAALGVHHVREALGRLFNAEKSKCVIFTPGATIALHMLLNGFLTEGGHVITTGMEHNAVMRPLHNLSKKGVVYDAAPCGRDGSLDPEVIIPLIKPNTKAVVMTHASNVCGTVLPVEEVYGICRERGIRLIVDAAQTAGVLDVDAAKADAVVFAGHKGLLGAQGLGGFVVKEDFAGELSPVITGGTGSQSHELSQPEFLPDKFESGTMNIPAVMGLKQALEYIETTGMAVIREKEMTLTQRFIEGLADVPGVNVVGRKDTTGRLSVVSLVFTGMDNGEAAAALDARYGIMTRCGLHCAPVAHKTLGTYPKGTVRFSFGHMNTTEEIDYILASIKALTGGGKHAL